MDVLGSQLTNEQIVQSMTRKNSWNRKQVLGDDVKSATYLFSRYFHKKTYNHCLPQKHNSRVKCWRIGTAVRNNDR